MKNNQAHISTAFKLIFFAVFFLAPTLSFAATNLNYVPMENIPGFEAEAATSDFYTYIQAIYKFGIWGVGIASLLMVVIGGFMYITSAGNTSDMGKAKDVITDAIVGILMALLSYLLLYIINPDLVRIKKITPVSAPTTLAPPVAPPPSGTYSHTEAKDKLSAAGITISSTGQCSDQNNSSCTSLQGIPQSTITQLIQLKKDCGCSVTVSGGTETGHQSHGTGKSAVDLSFNQSLAAYLLKNASALNISQICTTPADKIYRYKCTFDETSRHLHVGFSS